MSVSCGGEAEQCATASFYDFSRYRRLAQPQIMLQYIDIDKRALSRACRFSRRGKDSSFIAAVPDEMIQANIFKSHCVIALCRHEYQRDAGNDGCIFQSSA